MATKSRHMKTPTQLWVADNRKRLGLTPADLAALTGVTEDTARGWESRGRPSQDAMDLLVIRFGVPVPDDSVTPATDSAAYLARIDALVEQLAKEREQQAEDRAVIRSLIALLRGTPQGPGPEPLIELATREVEAVDEAAGKPRPQTTSQRRRSARGRPSAERRRESREGETA